MQNISPKKKTVLYIYMIFLEKKNKTIFSTVSKNLETQISPKITGMTVLL